ncbi:MAG TPA: hypothetical protein VFU13_20505 [Steroidobacteraceae bacterium]|nr:hypothetical protein [Steroidobacteraceae bacterium]
MPHLLDLAERLEIADGDSYILSYPHLLAYFQSKQVFTVSEFTCGAHMVYGWMPTILELYQDEPRTDIAAAADILSTVRQTGSVVDQDLDRLARLMNNSLVGASKLLHFSAPDSFAIWDSRIYTYLHKKKPHYYQVRDVANYRNYHDVLVRHMEDERFDDFHAIVNRKVGYAVSPLRALELVMFQNSAMTGV